MGVGGPFNRVRPTAPRPAVVGTGGLTIGPVTKNPTAPTTTAVVGTAGLRARDELKARSCKIIRTGYSDHGSSA